jgi:hypothetical protein
MLSDLNDNLLLEIAAELKSIEQLKNFLILSKKFHTLISHERFEWVKKKVLDDKSGIYCVLIDHNDLGEIVGGEEDEESEFVISPVISKKIAVFNIINEDKEEKSIIFNEKMKFPIPRFRSISSIYGLFFNFLLFIYYFYFIFIFIFFFFFNRASSITVITSFFCICIYFYR